MGNIIKILESEPHIVFNETTKKYINPNTDWDNANLYFGMGGGSQELTSGLPFDILGLLFTAELLKRKIKIKKSSILIADVITKTNPFPEKDIDRVCLGEKEIMEYLIKLFKFENWDVVLHSDLHKDNEYPEYISFLKIAKENIDKAIADSPFKELAKDARGHKDNYHFALESALTHYLVGNGIHLGWYIPGPNISSQDHVSYLINKYGQSGLKRMDEEPFDSYYTHLMKIIGETDKITPIYVKAAFKIYEDKKLIERVPPYICYSPQNRILLGDNISLKDKISDGTGKLIFAKKGEIKRYYKDIIRLTIKLNILNFKSCHLLDQIQELLDYINKDAKLKKIYKKTFEN
jgi:hypothetical protein